MPGYKKKSQQSKKPLALPAGKTILVAGSTHPGEEEILSTCFVKLRQEFPELFFVIAPRNIERSSEIGALFENLDFTVVYRSEKEMSLDNKDLLIVDTMGELVDFYQQGNIVFVGGSLVPFGGHNPLEPAAFGKPVFFGPRMEDFADIVAEMLNEGAATQVGDVDELCKSLQTLIVDHNKREKAGEMAYAFVEERQGVTDRHLEVIATLFR
jgi:3-deoxy-D-manno-octulosonic-acid transferase